MQMNNKFLYEFNCIEDGEWIPEKVTFEDRLVQDLRRSWNHQNLVSRSDTARWRFKRQQREVKRLIRELRTYRSNREFAPDIHQSLENWYLQNREKRIDIASPLHGQKTRFFP